MRKSLPIKDFDDFNERISVEREKHSLVYNVEMKSVLCLEYIFECPESTPIVTKRILRRGIEPVLENVPIDSVNDMYNLYCELRNGRLENEYEELAGVEL